MENKMIGIVGGIGSYAGIDLIRKIYDLTDAACDQEHLPVSMLSAPHKIIDRTKYLIGATQINPGIAISEIIDTLISKRLFHKHYVRLKKAHFFKLKKNLSGQSVHNSTLA